MKKRYLLLLGVFSLMYAQLRQYFVVKPTREMELVLESIQRIEQEIQNLGKIFKKTFKQLPDSFLYTPHSFTQNVSWLDLEKALRKTILHLYRISYLINKMMADQYESYEHPVITVFNYNEKIWLDEIQILLEHIKDFQNTGFPEREFPRKKYYNQPPSRLSSSIYHPSTLHVARERWQERRSVQPKAIEEQEISELD